MDCHFAGEYSDTDNYPFVKIKLDKKYVIKKLTVFNADNGADSSLLESSTIFVGDQKCATMSDRLIRNEYLNFTCQDINRPQVNVFDESQVSSDIGVFDGIEGDEITIQASKFGVLMVCDIQIIATEYLSNLEELQAEIQQKKDTCQALQDSCRINFDIAENEQNCLERYGIPKNEEFCSNIIPATSDIFEYKLKNKWDCMLSPHNDFVDLDQISDEYVECVGLYFDYKVETCLQNLQSQEQESIVAPIRLNSQIQENTSP